MATSCSIGLYIGDNQVKSIYCHNDGYIQGVGRVLFDNYDSEAIINKLLKLGDLSTLGSIPFSDPDLWTIKAWEETDYCRAYKDRGDKGVDAQTTSLDKYLNENNYCSFKYLYKDNEWYCKESVGELRLLSDRLGKPRLTEDILENKLNEELRIEEDMNFEFIGKEPEAQTADVEVKDIGAVNPVYADAVRQMRKADEKRAEYTELPKAEEREEAPKFKGSQEQKKMHLSEALFEGADEDEEDISIKDVLKEIIAKFGNHKYRYKLVAQTYEGFTDGSIYKRTFFAPNDYIALFSMIFHGAPTVERFEDYMGGYDLKEYLNDYPTYESLLEMASSDWWGDGDDYIFSLENLTTGKTLYMGNDDGFEEEDDDTYDFEESIEPDSKKQLEEDHTSQKRYIAFNHFDPEELYFVTDDSKFDYSADVTGMHGQVMVSNNDEEIHVTEHPESLKEIDLLIYDDMAEFFNDPDEDTYYEEDYLYGWSMDRDEFEETSREEFSAYTDFITDSYVDGDSNYKYQLIDLDKIDFSDDVDLEEDFNKKVKSNPKTWDDFYGVFQKHYKVYPSREKDGWFKLQLKTDDEGNQRGNFDAAKEICAKYGLECRATEGPSYKFPYITVFEPKGE